MSWTKVWFEDQDEYANTDEAYENWRRKLYDIPTEMRHSFQLVMLR